MRMSDWSSDVCSSDLNGSFRSENLTSGVTQFGDNDENLFSYRAGAVFKPTPASSIYVSYANSETPALATVRLGCVSNRGSFCDTAPEKAVKYEIGAKLELMAYRNSCVEGNVS